MPEPLPGMRGHRCWHVCHRGIPPEQARLPSGGVDGEEEAAVYVSPVGKLKSGRAAEWSGEIDRVTREQDTTRMWVKSYSWWEGDVYVVEFPSADVSEYVEGDYVGISGEIIDVCSSYDGWPLVQGVAIERREDPDAE